jgi:DNA-binding LytR/AlgR family response regulator
VGKVVWNRLLKVYLTETLWLQADGSYVHLHTLARKYTVRVSLREMAEKLPAQRQCSADGLGAL